MSVRTPEEMMATEREVLSDAVIAALHTLIDLASDSSDKEIQMAAATRILLYATDLEVGPDFDAQESEEVVDGDNGSEA